MNASTASPRTPTSISVACPWCDAPIAVEDAFHAEAIRCDACAIVVDLEPAVAAGHTIRAAA